MGLIVLSLSLKVKFSVLGVITGYFEGIWRLFMKKKTYRKVFEGKMEKVVPMKIGKNFLVATSIFATSNS
jgi:hypothetical protein